ncbi:hypothetical protein L1049_004176 [Liquidambar formosana]|uniref:SS18 N-terminal domain-containing protein n=1 Tax=Liquidambar formosana TaxID=63359 RepID=A0AAP0RMY0_LIQFO
MQRQPMMASSAGHNIPTNITSDHIQQYLDENNALILKILKNQNSGELSECAENQAKLQQNLMYLAAIADCQPQPPSMHAQFSAGANYMQQQQSQQMMPQSLLAARSPMLYGQQQLYSALQQQQAFHSQLGMSSAGTSGVHMLHSETNVRGGGTSAFPEIGCSTTGEGLQPSIRGLSTANKLDLGSAGSAEGREGNLGRQGRDKGEAFYLKSE